MSIYKKLTHFNNVNKVNPKKVLILQYEGDSVEISKNGATSGTTKCALELFDYLNKFDDYSCTYIAGTGIPDKDDEYFNESYDVVVFNHLVYIKTFNVAYKTLKRRNIKLKSVFISHCLDYSDECVNKLFKIVDAIICPGEQAYKFYYDKVDNKSKYHLIYNPVNVDRYIKVDKSKVENKILILYHPIKGHINIFVENILPLIREKIPDAYLHICAPAYRYPYLRNATEKYNSEYCRFVGALNKAELIKELKTTKCVFSLSKYKENLPYSVIEASLTKCIVLHNYEDDGVCQVNSDYYKTKFKAPELSNYQEFAEYVIDKLKNYDSYKLDLEYEQNYIANKFRKENILPLWKNVFDNI